MKKLFTLALVLVMATVGYSQVQKMARPNAKEGLTTMQKAPRMDAVNANAQSDIVMTSTRGEGELDYTTYDWQTNSGAITRTIVWPDGKVNFAFTCASDNNFSDRGTAIGTYDINTDEFTPSGGRVESVKTGFGSIARYGENGIIVAAHTASQCGVFMIEDKDNITPNAAPAVSYFDPTYDPCWPNVMTSGANRDIIHVIATADAADGSSVVVPGAEGVKDPIVYFRSTDGGESWDKSNVILPFMGPEYCIDWGSNVCYWMETTEDNCLALVINNAWSDGMVIYSYDDGETWQRKVFYHHPNPFFAYDDESPVPEEQRFYYPRWTSAQWGVNHTLSIAYEWNGSTGEAQGDGSYYAGLGGVAFWSEYMPYACPDTISEPWAFDPNNPMPPVAGQPFIIDTAYIFNDIYAAWPRWADQSYDNPAYFGYVSPLNDETGEWEAWDEAESFNIPSEDFKLHGAYNCGIAVMPALAAVPGNEIELVTVWSSMDEDNTDENGNYYFKLFAAYSCDGGNTWSRPVHLTNDFMWSYNEFVYVQAAITGRTLVIAAQTDNATGTFVQSDETEPGDCYYQGFSFLIDDLFETDGTPEQVSNNVHMNLFPNPAVDQLNITLNSNAEIVIYNIMGEKVMSQQCHAGANSINVNSLSCGVYFVNAGNDTQKFIVK